MQILTVSKKILVTVPDYLLKIIEKELVGKMGNSNSEVVKNIIITYVSQEGYFKAGGKK